MQLQVATASGTISRRRQKPNKIFGKQTMQSRAEKREQEKVERDRKEGREEPLAEVRAEAEALAEARAEPGKSLQQ